jgi:hypothetical protein
VGLKRVIDWPEEEEEEEEEKVATNLQHEFCLR